MRRFGYSGRIYPISRSNGQLHGLRAYLTVSEVNDPVDMVVIITPPATVPDLIEECGQKGIHAAVIVSEGFGESGSEMPSQQ